MELSRISSCTYALRERPLAETLSIVASAGFTKVDLLGRMPHLDLDPKIFDPTSARALAASHGLTIANLGTYVGANFGCGNASQEMAEERDVRRAIDLAIELGARSIRVKPGVDDPERIPEIAAGFMGIIGYAARKGLSRL